MKKQHIPTFKEAVSEFLSQKEMERFRRAFDTVGDIAVLEIPPELEKKEKKIAQTLLNLQNNIKVVVKKVGGHTGIFRRQKYKILAGERRKTTIHKENGVLLKLHIEESYFSPRQSTERLRVAQKIRKNERILVMFCGIAPFNVVIAKNCGKERTPKEIVGVEINPKAIKFAEENIRTNKVEHLCTVQLGDVRKVLPTLQGTFDRIFMPLPKDAEHFLDIALTKSHKGTIIHMYDFLHKDEFDLAKEKVKSACTQANRKYEILEVVKCGQQSPRIYRICVDFKIKD